MARSEWRCRACGATLALVRADRGSVSPRPGVRATINLPRQTVTLRCPCGGVRPFALPSRVAEVVCDLPQCERKAG